MLRAGQPEGWKRAGGGKAAGQRKVTRFLLEGGVGWPGGGAGCERGCGAGEAGCKVDGGAFGGRPRRGGWAVSISASEGVWHGFTTTI